MSATIYAFPSGHNPNTGRQESGMTLRDYFAAQVMKGLLCQDSNVSAPLSLLHEMLAVRAYQIADEMMKVRDV